MRKMLFGLLTVAFLIPAQSATTLFAANDPGIKGQMRVDIQNAMRDYIQENQVKGVFLIFDPVKAMRMERLTFKELHPGIVTMQGFYVSCADFVSADGTPYDVDFMVAKGPHGYRVVESVIHAVAGEKRLYHRERER